MKSGLRGRNNAPGDTSVRVGVRIVSMKSGLRDRNNEAPLLQGPCREVIVSRKSGPRDRNNPPSNSTPRLPASSLNEVRS